MHGYRRDFESSRRHRGEGAARGRHFQPRRKAQKAESEHLASTRPCRDRPILYQARDGNRRAEPERFAGSPNRQNARECKTLLLAFAPFAMVDCVAVVRLAGEHDGALERRGGLRNGSSRTVTPRAGQATHKAQDLLGHVT